MARGALRATTLIVTSLLVALACSSSGGSKSGDGAGCTALVDRLRSCGVLDNGKTTCDVARPAAVAQSEKCIADCMNQATCAQVHDYECSPLNATTPLGSCIHQCGTAFPGIFPGALQPGHPLFIFTCSDGRHVGRCDAVRECTDGADEQGCPMFACANGQMILEIKHCDYMKVDCSDGSDEADCAGGGIFHCTQGPPIVANQQCDGTSQCLDGSDEKTCFTCGDGKKLVPYKQCNFTSDCTDGKDELGCAQIMCDAPTP